MFRPVSRIIPINLKRREDKLCAYYGAMQSWGVKPSMIEPFEAHDAADYETVYDIREAAYQQFPFWKKLTDSWLDQGHLGKGSLCCLWSMQSVLEQIGWSDKNELSIMMTDHFCLRRLFWKMERELNDIGDWDIFQLDHWYYNFDYTLGKTVHPPTFPTPIYHFPSVSEGLAGAGDVALALTALGARRILEWCEERPYHLVEIVLYYKSFETTEGCVSAIVPSDWVWGPIEIEPVSRLPDSERLANG